MIKLNLTQGSAEWLAARMEYFTASEAPACMGDSKHHSRNQLLDHKKGWITEINEFTQKLFEKGHATENAARPIAEAIIEDELYPVVGVLEGTKFLASFDGLTICNDIAYEHKLFNKVLSENVINNLLEPHYYWQLEHQLLVSGADSVIFVTSDGTENLMQHMMYESVPERRAALIAGWAQFEKDLATHEMQAKAEKVIADNIVNLPALKYEMKGMVLKSNFTEFEGLALLLIEHSEGTPETDQDFANAIARNKVFLNCEAELDRSCESALTEAIDISQYVNSCRELKELLRQARIREEKFVKKRKAEMHGEILNAAKHDAQKHRNLINVDIKAYLPNSSISIEDAMKGKRTIESLKDAAATALSHIKIEADEQARIARSNIETLKELAADYKFLFNDWKDIAFKANDDFQALVKTRIAEHKQQEEVRLNAERERIRAEEQAKAQREVEAKAKAERDASEVIERQAEQAKSKTEQAQQVQSETPAEYITKPKPDFFDAQVKHAQQVHADKQPAKSLSEYHRGYIDGLEAYSWYKDGVQVVGSDAVPLKDAVKRFLLQEAA